MLVLSTIVIISVCLLMAILLPLLAVGAMFKKQLRDDIFGFARDLFKIAKNEQEETFNTKDFKEIIIDDKRAFVSELPKAGSIIKFKDTDGYFVIDFPQGKG